MEKINGNEIRPGYIIQFNGRLCVANKTQHVKPGKGGAFMQVELKDIQVGTKFNERFRADETVTRVRLEQIDHQYLYDDGDNLVFMNTQNFEQITMNAEMLGDSKVFLQENMVATIEFFEDKPVGISLPDSVVLEIVEAEPVVKGQTASSSFKPAILSNGVKIMVPPHIGTGVKVVVNTADGSYVERYKGD